MKYLFLDNFRGFSNSIIPLKQVNFLVGENSTGKSSFLKLVNLFSQDNFRQFPERSIQEYADLGSFNDIVSAWSTDRSYFIIGLMTCDDENLDKVEILLYEFGQKSDGTVALLSHTFFLKRKILKLNVENNIVMHYNSFSYENKTLQKIPEKLFLQIINKSRKFGKGRNIGKSRLPISQIPIAFLLTMISDRKPGNQKSVKNEETMDIFMAMYKAFDNLVWIAPIRTKPERFYGSSVNTTFSPDGTHSPYLLKKTLEGNNSSDFHSKLKSFGQVSGLFDTILTHKFGESQESPFEILICFKKEISFNINNVGYGVSQVLPLVVELLNEEDADVTFAIQQPEIHLHPRAQSAFGDLIAAQARLKHQQFLIETHSDYIIDRFRLNLSRNKNNQESKISAQVLFFQRCDTGNRVSIIPISENGKYSSNQPDEFKDFFINEEMQLLEI